MATVIIFVTVFLLVVLPLGLVAPFLILLPDLGGPTSGDSVERSTVLRAGQEDVLGALDAGDLRGARKAFIVMTRACGGCTKLFCEAPPGREADHDTSPGRAFGE